MPCRSTRALRLSRISIINHRVSGAVRSWAYVTDPKGDAIIMTATAVRIAIVAALTELLGNFGARRSAPPAGQVSRKSRRLPIA
mgnify:CR=1 FL=1